VQVGCIQYGQTGLGVTMHPRKQYDERVDGGIFIDLIGWPLFQLPSQAIVEPALLGFGDMACHLAQSPQPVTWAEAELFVIDHGQRLKQAMPNCLPAADEVVGGHPHLLLARRPTERQGRRLIFLLSTLPACLFC
jgi:hypothetical protein